MSVDLESSRMHLVSNAQSVRDVIVVETEAGRSLPAAELIAVSVNPAPCQHVTTVSSAATILERMTGKENPILVINEPHFALLQKFRQLFPAGTVIFVTDLPMEKYSPALQGQEEVLVDHVLANRTPSAFTPHEFRITLQKLLRHDIFGIEKYFHANAKTRTFTVTSSADREHINAAIEQFALNQGLSHQISKLAYGISEELLMNAIYDAPVRDGKHHYSALPRSVPVNLDKSEYSTLTVAHDHVTLGICVADPFGALQRQKLFQYIRKVIQRNDGVDLIDKKDGGAGLGLYKMLYSCHSLVCNVAEGVKTEVIALIDTATQIRDFSKMPRSIHYFRH